MYSRNRSVSADERYAKNLPPVYGGSRFYRGAGTEGIAVQYEAKPREIELEVPASPQVPADDAESPACIAEENFTSDEPSLCLTDADTPPPKPCEKHEKTGGFLQSILSGEQEELLLITLLLLLSGEQDRCVDVIVILVLLLIVR